MSFMVQRAIGTGACLLWILAVCQTSVRANVTDERYFQFGDNGAETAFTGEGNPLGYDNDSNPTTPKITRDTVGPSGAFLHMNVRGDPTYTNVGTGATVTPSRPGVSSANDWAAEFDGTGDVVDSRYGLNIPSMFWDDIWLFSTTPDYPLDYEGITTHAMQAWVLPTGTAGARQDIMVDTSQHAIYIAANGNWAMDFEDNDLVSTVSAFPGGQPWFHVMMVSGADDPEGNGFGAVGGQSAAVLYVDGIAVQARVDDVNDISASDGYRNQAVVSMAIGGSMPSTFNGGGGWTNFFTGVIDDAHVSLWGDNSNYLGEDGTPSPFPTTTGVNADGQDWGALFLDEDNAWIANHLAELADTLSIASVNRADVDLDGDLTSADIDMFKDHWLETQTVNGVVAGDWNSRETMADLNYDGRTDLKDWAIIVDEFVTAGMGALVGVSVPEPSSVAIALLGILGGALVVGRRRRSSQSFRLWTCGGLVALLCGPLVNSAMSGQVINVGADTELQEQTPTVASGTDIDLNVRTVAGDLPNELIYLRFDVSTVATTDNIVTVSLVNARTQSFQESLYFFGLNNGVTGESSWSETTTTYDDAPGLFPDSQSPLDEEGASDMQIWDLISASDPGDNSTAQVTLLGKIASVGPVEAGERLIFTSDALSDFVDADTNNQVTIIVARAPSGRTTQLRFNSKEEPVVADPEPQLGINAYPTLVINRQTGNATLKNVTSSAVALSGYAMESGRSALDPTQWLSVSENYDATGTTSAGLVDADDEWEVLSAVDSNTDLSEAVLGAGSIATSANVDFGDVWRQNLIEDVSMTLLLSDGSDLRVPVLFTGAELKLGDFDFDGDIDTLDWQTYKAGFGTDLSALDSIDAYAMGDVNDDKLNDHKDFILFRDAYDAANGAGAFLAMLQAVPEPSSIALAGLGMLIGCLWQRRKWRTAAAARLLGLGVAVSAVLVLTASRAEAQTLVTVRAEADTNLAEEYTSTGGAGGSGEIQLRTDPVADPNVAANWRHQMAILRFPLADFGVGALDSPKFVLYGAQDRDPDDEFDVHVFGFFEGDAAAWDEDTVIHANYEPPIYADAPSGQTNVGDEYTLFSPDGLTDQEQYKIWDLMDNDTNAMVVQPLGSMHVTGLTTNQQYTFASQALSDFLDEAVNTNGDDTVSFILARNIDPSGNLYRFRSRDNSESPALSPALQAFTGIPGRPTLTVDRATGEVVLGNSSGANLDIEFYEIRSPAGSLVSGNWDSLESQDLGGFPAGDGTGNGWEELGTANSTLLAEAYLTAYSTFTDGMTGISFGNIFALGGTEDLEFNFGFAGGSFAVDGIVNYINEAPVGLPGDYNGDDVVDAADYTVWRDTLGSTSDLRANGDDTGGSAGVIDEADYAVWKLHFGETLGSGSSLGESATVPEPSTLVLAICVALLLIGNGRAIAMPRR